MESSGVTRRFGRWQRVALAIATIGVLTAGCSNGSGGGTGSTERVTIAGGDQVGAAQFLVAEAQQLWTAESLEAARQSFPSGRDALNALIGGQAQFATIGDLPTVTAVLSGRKLNIVANLSWGVSWRLLTTTSSGVNAFPDLRGKRIGVTEGTNTQYLLSKVLADGGLTPSDVTVVNLAASQIPASLSAGDIDAGFTFPSFYAATKKALGPRYRELVYPGYQSPTLLVARTDVSDAQISKVLTVLNRAQKVVDDDPAKARADVVAASNNTLTADNVNELWPLYQVKLGLDVPLRDALVAEAEWATTSLPITVTGRPADLAASLYPAPLRSVSPGLVSLP
ncbi:ABC transporter substrate-binding protein [Tsukamurella asaccharolytica]|nr:ABC transporter substrate-binding protein [Tsukamurella asaccharolytica]